jgi:hypothetical protein
LQQEGTISADLNPSTTADYLMAQADGLGVRATIDPESWPPQRLYEHLDRALAIFDGENLRRLDPFLKGYEGESSSPENARPVQQPSAAR